MLIIEKEKDKGIEQILSIWSLLKKNWWYGHVLDIFNLQQNKSFIYNNKASLADGVCPVPILLNGNSFRFVSLILNVDEIYSLWGEELKEITLINKQIKILKK